ncbi:hypothetical protein D3C75_292870 [compost metagenome]
MNTLLNSRLSKLILATAIMFSGFFAGSAATRVYADSPVTSTAIYKAYLDVDIVAAAEKSGLNRTVADYLASSGNPLDVKAAAINALYSDLAWSDREHAEEYSQLVYGKSTAALDKSALSAQQLFVIGYLKVLDHYLDPDITWITAAQKALPDSQTVALIHALAASQQNMDCSWVITEQVLDDTELTKDLRQGAVNIITEYMVLYKGSPCQSSGEQPGVDRLADDILQDAVVLSIGQSAVLVKGNAAAIDSANSSVVPYIRNNTTMVPLKFISDKFGARIEVNTNKLEATVVYLNQKTVVPKVEIRNGRTFVPLRAVMDIFKKQTYYNKGLIIITANIALDAQNPLNQQAAELIRKELLSLK